MTRNRIVRHVRVAAKDLVPHEMNPRTHSEAQRQALHMLYEDIGFARSLLAYELPDGRLKLIDGHLRRDVSPEMLVDVEVLDVTDAEARALLLVIDPMTQLAGYNAETLNVLLEQAAADYASVKTLWKVLKETTAGPKKKADSDEAPRTQFFVMIECEDESEQLELLKRFLDEGLKCEAKLG